MISATIESAASTEATSQAHRLLTADPSFWDALRSSWLVNHTWRPRIDAWASLNGEAVRVLAKVGSDDSFAVQLLDGSQVVAPRADLTQAPYVPWAVIKRHAVPKLAIAGIEHAKVEWEQLCDELHQHDDPVHRAATQDQDQDECAADAPRA
jgi:hypothetical protein